MKQKKQLEIQRKKQPACLAYDRNREKAENSIYKTSRLSKKKRQDNFHLVQSLKIKRDSVKQDNSNHNESTTTVLNHISTMRKKKKKL